MSKFEFEKPITDLDQRIEELKKLGSQKVDIQPEIKRLEVKREKLAQDIYANLTAWQRVQIARHPKRPYTFDYINAMTTDFMELHGDRLFADDQAIVGGFARLDGQKVMILGHQKGRDVKENLMRNFGCAHPEGYRKAMRLMHMAEKFNTPIICLIDTPGAYPGIGAEERGQAQAIAESIRDMSAIKTPIVAVVIGEGGSGGALGIGVADRVLMLEHSYYSVISPEGCASILWRSSSKAPEAASVLKLHGEDLMSYGIVDEIIPEPLGGAHRDPQETIDSLKAAVLKHLKKLSNLNEKDLLDGRYEKFRSIGEFTEPKSK